MAEPLLDNLQLTTAIYNLQLTTTIDNLPDDVIFFIIRNLPVESIRAASQTRQAWRVLIHSNLFVSTHLKKSYGNPTHLIVAAPPTYIFFPFNHDGGIGLPNYVQMPQNDEFKLIGSCNGLLLESRQGNRLSVFNPFNNYKSDIPNSNIDFGPGFDVRRMVLGFFFDGQSDFKIVRYPGYINTFRRRFGRVGVFLNLGPQPAFEIFRFRTGQWEMLPVQDLPCNHLHAEVQRDFNGYAHWVASNNTTNEYRGCPRNNEVMILTFNHDNERFGRMAVPEQFLLNSEERFGWSYTICLLVINNKLALVMPYPNDHPNHVLFWVMNTYGVQNSWMIMYQVNFNPIVQFVNVIEYTRNGEAIIKVNVNGVRVLAFNMGNFPQYRQCAPIEGNQPHGPALGLGRDDVAVEYVRTMARFPLFA